MKNFQIFTEIWLYDEWHFFDVFQSLVNIPVLSDRFIRVVMTAVKYTLNFFIDLDGIGSIL